VKGGAHLVGWSQIETARHVYDWSIMDQHVNEFSAAGKPSVLLLAPTSYGSTDSYLPWWFLGPTVDIDGAGSVCASGRIPVYWNDYFISAWQELLTEAVDRYGSNRDVVGIRPGFGCGFENYACRNAGPNAKRPCGGLLAGVGYTTGVWVAYLEQMIDFMGALAPELFQWSLNYTSYGSHDPANVQALAQYAVDAGVKVLVTAGLEQDDKNSTTGGNDWLEVYAQQKGLAAMGGQMIGASDPTGTAVVGTNSQRCGSLATILPWDVQHGVQYLEVYAQDLLSAWDPSNVGYAAAQDDGYPALFSQIAGLIN